jgi:predicted anti-sigma-YlaC factor YlaD
MKSDDEKYRIMLSGYIDGELNVEEKSELEKHLQSCEECRKELDVFRRLKEVTGAMKYADVPDYVWDNYWRGIYRRLELGIGWILLSIGVILLLGFGLYCLVKDFFLNPGEPLILKIAVAAGGLGLIVLLVSAVRERLFAYRRDRYREIEK